MHIARYNTVYVQEIARSNRAKAVVLHGNSYRFARQRLSLCGIKGKELLRKTYRFRVEWARFCLKTPK